MTAEIRVAWNFRVIQVEELMETLVAQLGAGDINITTGLVFVLIGILAGACGGAIGGIKLGGQDIGRDLALMMGAFFGPLASLPGVILALLVLAFI